jgi:hypothetical protein
VKVDGWSPDRCRIAAARALTEIYDAGEEPLEQTRRCVYALRAGEVPGAVVNETAWRDWCVGLFGREVPL